MPKLQHRTTGVVVSVSDDHAFVRSPDWRPVDAKAPASAGAPKRRRGQKRKDDDGMADSG